MSARTHPSEDCSLHAMPHSLPKPWAITIVLAVVFFISPVLAQDGTPSVEKKEARAAEKTRRQEETIPPKLALRLKALREEIDRLSKPDDALFAAMKEDVYALAADLDAARCPATAAHLLFDWAKACQTRFFRPSAALEGYTWAEAIFRRLGDERSLATIAINRGVVYRATSRYEEALGAYKQAEEVFRDLGDEEGLASIALNRGNVYQSASRYEEALEAYRQARVIYRRLGDESHLASISVNRGNVYLAISRFEEALGAYRSAEVVFRRLGDDHRLAQTALNRGTVFFSTSRYEEALEAYAQADGIFRRLGDERHLALIALNRGNVYRSTCRYPEALDAYGSAEAVFRRLGIEHRLALVAFSRGTVYVSTSRYGEALEAFAHSQRIFRRLGIEHRVALTALNRGLVYTLTARYEEAIETLAAAEAILQRLGDEGGLAKIAVNRGEAYQSTGRFNDTLEAYDVAEAIYKRLGDEGSLGAVALARGNVFQSTGRFQEALEAYRQAEAIFQRLDDEHRLAKIALNRGNMYRSVSRYEEALDAYGSAEAIFRRLGDAGSLAAIALNRGPVYQSTSRYVEAIATYGRGLKLLERRWAHQVKRLGGASTDAERASWSSLPGAVADAAWGLVSEGKDDAAAQFRGAALAFRAVEVIAGRRVLEKVFGDPAALTLERWPEEERQALVRIQGERRQLLKRRDELASAPRNDAADGELTSVVERLGALDREERQFAEAVRLVSPLAAQAVYPKAATVAEVQKDLPSDAALVELAVQDELAWGFVFTHQRFAMVKLGDPKRILADLKALRGDLAGRSSFLDGKKLARLSRNVLDPVLAELTQEESDAITSLVFSLKGELARLPMEVLLTEGINPSQGAKDFPFLVKRYDVAYVPSATTLVAMHQAKALKKKRDAEERLDFFAVGMPLDVAAEAVEEGRETGDLGVADLDPVLLRGGENRVVLYGSADETFHIAELFATEEEKSDLEALSERLQDEDLTATARVSGIAGKRFRILLRGGAHEKAFKEHADLVRARFVHFAGHGEADLTSPSFSRLVFAQSPRIRKETGEDGFLYFNELAQLGLHADLLALSACATNDGVLYPTEGLVGLAQAGLLAGAESVLSTLWAVDDGRARELMTDFYGRLIAAKKAKPISRAKALADSKRAAIARGVPASSWSAYILWDAGGNR